MQNPFVTLGLSVSATAEQVRAAYHERVKQCHPDRMRDEASKQAAQERLVQLNLAYAEAMRQAKFRRDNGITIGNAKQAARRLLEEGRVDSALRMLNKAADRDAEWFALHGSILLAKGEAEAAHACFRTAVRLEPDNVRHRELALDAAVRMRKKKTIRGRMGEWARHIVSKMP